MKQEVERGQKIVWCPACNSKNIIRKKDGTSWCRRCEWVGPTADTYRSKTGDMSAPATSRASLDALSMLERAIAKKRGEEDAT
jgi:hypothetical protein